MRSRRNAVWALLLATGCGAPDPGSGREESADMGPPDGAVAAGDALRDSANAPRLVFDPPDDLEDDELSAIREPWLGDFDAMAERRLIRVAVAHSRTLFFLDGPRPRGLTYEALTMFERGINEDLGTRALKVHVVIEPVPRDRLFDAVVSGQADIAAANLTITPARLELVDFSDPLMAGVREVLVTGPGGPAIGVLEDLSGREIHVRRSSSYHESLVALNERFAAEGREPVRIIPADERLENEDILELVNAGVLPATVVDSHVAALWDQILEDIIVHADIHVRDDGSIGWAFRKDSPRLAAVINEFARTHRAGTRLGNIVLRRYLRSTDYLVHPHSDGGAARFEAVRPVFERYGGEYGFDPLLLLAQGYQESGLDQGAQSRVGAVGIMQILPSTAADPNVGIPDVSDIDSNVHAATRYLRFVADRYFDDPAIGPLDQHFLAFAAYNAGPGRISRLRAEAEREGLDPNIWFQNVERVVARRVGREPTQYVSNIFKYYLAYRRIADLDAAVADEGA
ncbi:MAG: lytic transglycosylase F [Gemmatimonadota bacterium]|nr:lytic transglycosylase F [Gemmatimonadota bacterium]